MSMSRRRWGAASLWPITAIIVGVGGGFALGRTLKQAQSGVTTTEIVILHPEAAPVSEKVQPEAPQPEKTQPEAAPPEKPVAEAPKPEPTWTGHFRSHPAGATVTNLETGDPLGITPFDLTLPARDEPLKVVILKPGFVSVERTITLTAGPAGESTLDLTLEAEPPKEAVAAPESHVAPHHATPKRPIPKPIVSRPKHKSAGGDKAISNSTTIDPFN